MTTGRKILILESDRAAAFPLGAALRKNGWIVLSAQDAVMAVTFARQQKPDAVLLNSRLAGGGGIVALKRLRSSALTTLIPVICIVPDGSDEQKELIHSGAQETIDPPGDPAAIDDVLRRHLSAAETAVRVPPAVLAAPERLKALAESNLLDTPPDEKLDRVTRLAAKLAGAPLGRLSIVDTDRQFFKSQVDMSPTPVTLRETPLSHAICQWVVGGEEELVVDDARAHPVLRTNGAVTHDGVRAYAGVPFTIDGQSILGSFCVVDSKPHIWSNEQIANLRDLGAVARAYATMEIKSVDKASKMKVAGNALIGATTVLLREAARCDERDRRELSAVVQEMSGMVAALAA